MEHKEISLPCLMVTNKREIDKQKNSGQSLEEDLRTFQLIGLLRLDSDQTVLQTCQYCPESAFSLYSYPRSQKLVLGSRPPRLYERNKITKHQNAQKVVSDETKIVMRLESQLGVLIDIKIPTTTTFAQRCISIPQFTF